MDKFNKFSMDENSSRRTQSFKKAIPNYTKLTTEESYIYPPEV